MKSVRRTLILNLFLFLVLSFTIFYISIFDLLAANIKDKSNATKQLLQKQFSEQCDESLRREAHTLAGVVHSQMAFDELRKLPFLHMGLLIASTTPYAHAQIPLWAFETPTWDRKSQDLYFQLITKIEPNMEVFNRSQAATNSEFLQISNDMGSTWRSPSLKNESMPLKLLEDANGEKLYESFDNLFLDNGTQVRRITFRSPITRSRWQIYQNRPRRAIEHPERLALLGSGLIHGLSPVIQQRNNRGFGRGRPPGGMPPPPPPPKKSEVNNKQNPSKESSPPGSSSRPPDFFEQTVPYIHVQVAWELETHPTILLLKEKLDERIEILEKSTKKNLTSIQNKLFGIGFGVLAIILIGSWFLIGHGLKPIAKLSEAVSHISLKNFSLPVKDEELRTEVFPLVDRLRGTLKQLEEAFAREKRAAADISHELRTPIAALTTTIEVCLRKPRTNEEYKVTLEEAKSISKELKLLVERLLRLAWIDAGQDKVKNQDVNLDDLVSGCYTISKPLAEAKGLKFNMTLEPAIMLKTDPDKLREILMNLVHNAIEYNRPGGEINLLAKQQANQTVLIEVSDTGIGMPKEIHERIFERFFRGDASRNAVGAHAGLGLSIVKEYIERMGGKLKLDSQVGVGSRFEIELPKTSKIM